jgi:hypothetical protein
MHLLSYSQDHLSQCQFSKKDHSRAAIALLGKHVIAKDKNKKRSKREKFGDAAAN